MLDFTVVVLEGAYASSLAATLDLLGAARSLAARAGGAVPRWRVCSVAGGPVALQGGMTVPSVKLPLRARGDRSTWVVPGLATNTPALLRTRLAQADAGRVVAALAAHAGQGGAVAASCSAVFLLQAAGLLAGRTITTTWWLAPLLQQWAPGCRVDADRMVCADGPVTTAGAAMAHTDLMLHLLREQGGSALVDSLRRVLLLDAREAQAPFIVPEWMAGGSALVARLAGRVEAALPAVPAVSELARELAVSERTLARHVRRATGKSTLALVQSVRLRRARALLETSRLTVDQVAEAVGYQDATALRRMMRKAVGVNPGRYRGGGVGV
ncbi:MAG: helix-turn-helix domain-containing protein [Ramlibacter sp.]|nr:helix-turn-helix domain-containing protein [Ramlibacter sp.]